MLAVCSLEEATTLLDGDHRIGVVLTDTELVDGDWEDVVGYVRERVQVPVVVCSDLPSLELCRKVFRSGAYDLLVAPFRVEEVRRAVQSATARSLIYAASA